MRVVVVSVLTFGFLWQAERCNAEAAFALGQGSNGAYWWAVAANRQTLPEARAAALQSCLQRGPNCSIATTFRMGCFAIAAPIQGAGFTWATRKTQSEAQQFVLTECQSHGRVCQIKGSSCDAIDEAALAAQRRQAENQAAEQARQQRQAEEQAASQARQQRQAEQQAIEQARQQRQIEEQATEAARRTKTLEAQSAELRAFFASPVTQFAVSILVPLILIALKRVVAGAEPHGESVIKRIFVGTASSTLAATILHTAGVTSEITLLSIPIVGGLVLAFNYDKLHSS
jgi:multidrug efflux pump subunit AcrA (membrane-fusion protein)